MKKRSDSSGSNSGASVGSGSGNSRIQHMPVSGETMIGAGSGGSGGSAGASGSGVGGSSVSGSNLVFCPNMKLFEAVGIQLDSPSGITVSTVLRLPSHTLLRVHISQQEWLAAATASFGLTTAIAMRLFEVFYQNSVKLDSRLELTRVLLEKVQHGKVAPTTLDEYVALTSARTVSLPGFMMFLMAQLALERPPRAPVGEVPSETVISFVKQHLHDIVTSVAVTKQGAVTPSDVTELSYILREFANGVEAPIGTNLGFLWARQAEAVDLTTVSHFIRQRLIAPQDVKGSAATSATSVGVTRGISSAVHFITAAPPVTKPHAYFKISRCIQSSVYVTAPLPTTVVSGCSNCLIVLGPVSGMLVVDRLEHCQVVAICAGISVSNCKNVTFFVCSNSMPVLHTAADGGAAGAGGSVEDCKFAPFNTFYPTLEEHLLATGVNPMLNFSSCGAAGENPLPVELFSPITIPIAPQTSASVTTRSNPCPLPPHYATALGERMQCFNSTSKLLHDTYRQLEGAGRRDLAEALRTKVHQQFMDWLVESGQARGLLDLLNHTVAAGAGQ